MGRVGSILVTAVLAVTTVGVVAVPTTHAVGGTISGVVRDTGGNPIAGATVSVQSQANMWYYPSYTATTDATGAYTISGLAPFTWKVLAFAPGFAIRIGNAATFETGASVDITADEAHTFDVTLPRKSASISGRVTDPSGNPIGFATVRAMYKGSLLPSFIPGFESSGYFGFTTTDAEGRYVIADLAPTVFTIDFSPVDSSAGPPPPTPYLEEWYLDSRSEAGATPIELSEGVDTVIDAQLELGATISGRVTDPAGNPVAGVMVSSPANLPFGGPLTDADGSYTLTGVPPGDLAYVGAFPEDPRFLPGFYGGANFDTATHLQVGLGQVIEGIDIQLATPGNVNVVVFRPDGSTAPPAIVPCIAPGMPVVVPHPAPGFGPLIQCSSGGQVNATSSIAGVFRIPIGTYNAISAEGIGAFGVTVLNPSDIATFTLTADTAIDCVFHLGGAASCVPAETPPNDTTPPTITCPAPPSFILNRPWAKLSARVTDGDSGVAASVVTVRVSTSTVGPHDVAVSATDLAGNTATVSCSYSVGVRLARLISPNRARTTTVTAGGSVPIIWRAVDFYWRPVTDPNHFVGVDVTASSCVKRRVENLRPVPDRGLRYLGNGRWEFDWTAPTTTGCYTLKLSLAGASKTAHIKVK